jgi:uncharacterized protein (TIGR03905 family)
MKHTFKPKGVCAGAINFELDDNAIISNVKFLGGCTGNGQGVAKLVEGMSAFEAIRRLRGINCRNGTSCPDQLAKALQEIVEAK